MSAYNPTLATASARLACVWDLRCPSVSRLRPSLRFEVDGGGGIPAALVGCAADDRDGTLALLDSGGIVRMYDVRGGRDGTSGGGGEGEGGGGWDGPAPFSPSP